MEYDNEALEQKKAELRILVRDAIPSNAVATRETLDSAFMSFVSLTPPTKPETIIHMITMQPGGSGGGQSRKAGNIYLNWRKLVDLVPDAAIAAGGGITSPGWLLPFIGLYIWNKLWCSAREELTEVEATLIWALWKNRDGQGRISEDDGFDKTNELRRAVDLPPLSRKEFNLAINRLLRMECIEMEDGSIWLREWVRIKY